MKNTIFNFKQSELLNLNLQLEDGKTIKIDCTDIVILDWFVFFTPEMQNININGKIYYWLAYSKMQDDLPFLDLSKRSFADRLKKLCELKVLSFYLNKEQGNTTFYTFGENYFKLIKDNSYAGNYDLCGQNNRGYAVETAEGMQLKPQTYSSINNNSIIDSSNNKNIHININNNIINIFNYWNTKNIIKHNEINDDRKKAITKALKENSVENIKLAMDHYKIMLDDKNCIFKYKWTLEEFLTRQKGYKTFLNDGSNWVNYNSPKIVKQGLVNAEIVRPKRNDNDII